MTEGKNNSGNRNSGNRNSGNRNSGDFNSGDFNSGDYNSGDRNSGNRNSGDFNSGYYNSGSYNSGYYNSGSYNSGNCNSGNRNSGHCNSGDRNSGYFNTKTSKVRLFNLESDLDFNSDVIVEIIDIINRNIKDVCVWIYEDDMTDQEKEEYPTYKTTGGYLKKRDYKYCWKKGWEKMSKEEREKIKSLPNFCPKIFEEITGIDINLSDQKKDIVIKSNDLEGIIELNGVKYKRID
ncbi:MAG: pentapeptide repeat-containing protein [Candidatus Lokiarchaeota archaeon]|nr:pentapeptide repeat-containing protein [Candidatus Lokiarchaeota archaeon]